MPGLDKRRLDELRIDEVRLALRANQVTFPSPVPTFGKHDRADLQWRFAQLYFVLGWSCGAIAEKYGLIHQRVSQILKTWKRRAVEMGYIQFIPPVDVLGSLALPARPLRRASANGLGRSGLPATAFVNHVTVPQEVGTITLGDSGYR